MNSVLHFAIKAPQLDVLQGLLARPPNDSLTELLLAHLISSLDRSRELSQTEANLFPCGVNVRDTRPSVLRQCQPSSPCSGLNIARELSPDTDEQFRGRPHLSRTMSSLPHQKDACLGICDAPCNVIPNLSREDVKVGDEVSCRLDIDMLEIDSEHIHILVGQAFLMRHRLRSDDVHKVLLELNDCDSRNCPRLTPAQQDWGEPDANRYTSRKEGANRCPGIPIDATAVAKPPTLTHPIQHAHSLIPLWIGRHFAMPLLQVAA